MARRPTTSAAFQKNVRKCFPALLDEFRQHAGLTREKFAAKAGIENKHMYQLATGKVMPELHTVLRLLNALDDNTAELMSRMMLLIYPTPTSPCPDKQSAAPVSLGEEKCPWCPAVYSLEIGRVANREKHKFKCVSCKRVIAEWAGSTSFTYRLISAPDSLR